MASTVTVMRPTGDMPHQHRACPLEMVGPTVQTRVEQARHLLRVGIDTSDIWSLMPIAITACQGKVFQVTISAVLPRNYMIQ